MRRGMQGAPPRWSCDKRALLPSTNSVPPPACLVAADHGHVHRAEIEKKQSRITLPRCDGVLRPVGNDSAAVGIVTKGSQKRKILDDTALMLRGHAPLRLAVPFVITPLNLSLPRSVSSSSSPRGNQHPFYREGLYALCSLTVSLSFHGYGSTSALQNRERAFSLVRSWLLFTRCMDTSTWTTRGARDV